MSVQEPEPTPDGAMPREITIVYVLIFGGILLGSLYDDLGPGWLVALVLALAWLRSSMRRTLGAGEDREAVRETARIAWEWRWPVAFVLVAYFVLSTWLAWSTTLSTGERDHRLRAAWGALGSVGSTAPGSIRRNSLEFVIEHGADLRRIDLARWQLEDFTALIGRDLAEARLDHGHLQRASFRGANLRDAILRETDVSGADFRDATLVAAVAPSLHGLGTRFDGADLRLAHFERAKLLGASLRGVRANGLDARHAVLDGADLTNSNLRAARFDGASLVGARLAGADLTDASFVDADVSDADLRDARLAPAALLGARWRELPPRVSDVTRAWLARFTQRDGDWTRIGSR